MVEPILPGEFHSLILANLSLVDHVSKVADQVHEYILLGVLAHLLQPGLLYAEECLCIGHIEYYKHTVTPLIETPCYRPKTFLSCCVPNLQLNMSLFPKNHSEVAKLNAYSDALLLIELLVYQSLQQARLAHSRVTNNDYLEEHVMGDLRCCLIHRILIHHSPW